MTETSKLDADSYDASAIKILRPDEAEERFEWAQIGALAARFKKPEEWIERGFRACEFAGVDPRYFVRRYLEEDRSVPRHEGVEEAFRELHVRKVATL